MRALGLGVGAVVALVSLRPASDFFREPEPEPDQTAVAHAFIETPANSPGKTVPAFARMGATIAISLKAGAYHETGHDKPPAASFTDDDKERILAIKKELNRLGLYDGPMTPVWGDDAQRAARKFTRIKAKPSEKLLADLRAASAPAPKRERQAKREIRRKLAEAPAAALPAPTTGAASEGYLPPWPMVGGKELQTAQDRSRDRGVVTARKFAKVARVHRQKRAATRMASARPAGRSAGPRRRSVFANADFWPGL
jgi:hypothetical protein